MAFDRELGDLPQSLRWRTWISRIEAVLFAAAAPVPRGDLARVVGQGVSIELLIEDLRAELADRPYEVARAGDAWLLRTRPAFADAILASGAAEAQAPELSEREVAVLAAIAYHQPLTREDLKDILGQDVPRDLLSRLRARDLIAPGPRAPKPGAPYTFVTTQGFLAAFGLVSLVDLPDREAMMDAGLEGEWKGFRPA
ncbi:SMC-Scp complex subunit ScpB [Palleronia sp. LCG004]|uniref:SMC-Scp complex subunit ScpB n=1 Tax=Palleronia sp. LCG004 TaxID=3079304 RepID=UPI002941F28F|nr:SMC-Scp complex subunit ScpB [Palleronia sp. LCG004]WOI58096.1 SMC-Scp complex subunit ScpB [Palleronia sp. LCG004]